MSNGCPISPTGRRTVVVTAVVLGGLAALLYYGYLYYGNDEVFANGTDHPVPYPKKKKRKCKLGRPLNGSSGTDSSSSQAAPPTSQYMPAVPPAAVSEVSAGAAPGGSAPLPQNP